MHVNTMCAGPEKKGSPTGWRGGRGCPLFPPSLIFAPPLCLVWAAHARHIGGGKLRDRGRERGRQRAKERGRQKGARETERGNEGETSARQRVCTWREELQCACARPRPSHLFKRPRSTLHVDRNSSSSLAARMATSVRSRCSHAAEWVVNNTCAPPLRRDKQEGSASCKRGQRRAHSVENTSNTCAVLAREETVRARDVKLFRSPVKDALELAVWDVIHIRRKKYPRNTTKSLALWTGTGAHAHATICVCLMRSDATNPIVRVYPWITPRNTRQHEGKTCRKPQQWRAVWGIDLNLGLVFYLLLFLAPSCFTRTSHCLPTVFWEKLSTVMV